MATQHDILERHRDFPAALASLDQFRISAARHLADSDLAVDPNWTLYTLDFDSRQAVFLRMPDGVDLADAALAFSMQFEQATALALLPFEDLEAVAARAPQPARIVHLLSTGRCGSTLASRIFAGLDGVWSISEPDALTVLSRQRHLYGTPEMHALIRACLRLTYRRPVLDPDMTCVIKYRSMASFIATDMVAAMPEAMMMYLWREPVGYMKSVWKFAQRQGVEPTPGTMEKWGWLWEFLTSDADIAALSDFTDPSSEIPFVPLSLAVYALGLEAFLEAQASGIAFETLSYAQLNTERDRSVDRLLTALGADTPDNKARAMQAYEQDSHTGTAGANANAVQPMDAETAAFLDRFVIENARLSDAVDRMRRL